MGRNKKNKKKKSHISNNILKTSNSSSKTLCLNMIVKNESKTLPKLFKSLQNVINYYVILDTGSTDGTPDLIKEEMDKYKIKGDVHHMEWVNFAVCRQKALELAVGKSDYVLIIDADEELNYNNTKLFNSLSKDCYYLKRKYGNSEYFLPAIINISENNKLGWKWKGVVHNYLVSENKNITTENVLNDVWILSHVHGGAKSHGITTKEKYLRDVNLLKEELEKNPNDSRSQFYLAQSYRDALMPKEALEEYKKRINMGGWKEELFYSYYQVGKLMIQLNYSFGEVFPVFMKAYETDSRRIEPIYYLIDVCRKQKKYHLGYLLGKGIYNIRSTNALLFVDKWVYNYAMLDVFSVCSYWAGDYKTALECAKILLREKKMPEHYIQRIKDNMKFCVDKLNKN